MFNKIKDYIKMKWRFKQLRRMAKELIKNECLKLDSIENEAPIIEEIYD